MRIAYDRARRRDFITAGLLFLAGALLGAVVFAADRPWSHDMVEHGQWDVGKIIAVCDGSARVYAVRGDTGVALWVNPNGCAVE